MDEMRSLAAALNLPRSSGKRVGAKDGMASSQCLTGGQAPCRAWRRELTARAPPAYLPARMPQTISRARLASLLDAAPGHRIAIVGDAMLDVYLRGDVDRI